MKDQNARSTMEWNLGHQIISLDSNQDYRPLKMEEVEWIFEQETEVEWQFNFADHWTGFDEGSMVFVEMGLKVMNG